MVAVLPVEEEFKMITEFVPPAGGTQSEILDKISKVSNHYTKWQDIQAQKQE